MRRASGYHFSQLPAKLAALPFNLMELLLLRMNVHARHQGIRISNMTLGDQAQFVHQTIRCLDLIREASPRHFLRVQRHVGVIANSTIVADAHNRRFNRRVSVNFNKIWIESKAEACLRGYAMLLVHEATHGYLHALRFLYSKSTQSRIERICVNEGNRFLLHLGSQWAHLRQEFNQSDWDFPWHASRSLKLKLHRPLVKKHWREHLD